jgi:hypothetical protein
VELMNNLLILAVVLSGANCAFAGVPENSRASAANAIAQGFQAAETAGINGAAPAVPQPGLPQQVSSRQAPAHPHACQKPPVFIAGDGFIYNGQTLLGRGAVSFKTECTDNAAWLDRSGNLYKNKDRLGLGAKEYSITVFGGDVIWLDGYKHLYRDHDRIGNEVKKYIITAVSGDVIWTDRYDYLYKNTGGATRRIGSDVKEYKVSSFTGTVAWLDAHNYLYKTSGMTTVRLGQDVRAYAIASATGDVVWQDRAYLYKNNQRLGRDVLEYRMDARGIVYWKDSAGVQHTA